MMFFEYLSPTSPHIFSISSVVTPINFIVSFAPFVSMSSIIVVPVGFFVKSTIYVSSP